MRICVWNFQKAFLHLALLLFGCCMIVNPARAQDQIQPAPSQPNPAAQRQSTAGNFSILNVGVFAGRSGAANGPSGLGEFDPVRWFGVGAFAPNPAAHRTCTAAAPTPGAFRPACFSPCTRQP
jgi:hypothetical protein